MTFFLNWISERRQEPHLDDVETTQADSIFSFMAAHPRGSVGGHLDPESLASSAVAASCLVFRLPSLEEDPRCLPALTEALAAEAGAEGPFPSSLWRLPCPGNLVGLKNRLHRWQLLGQLPAAPDPAGALPLEAEDLATNLHALERILLFRVLRRSYGNRVEAAFRLGVSRRQLYLLIARHGDPVKGELATAASPKRLVRQQKRQNSSQGNSGR